MLYEEIATKVQAGELSWDVVLKEINQIKIETAIMTEQYRWDLNENAIPPLEIIPDPLNVESELIRLDIEQKLSESAQYVKNMVLYGSPKDPNTKEIFAPTQKRGYNISKERVYRKLRSLGWPRRRILMAFDELREFVRDVEMCRA